MTRNALILLLAVACSSTHDAGLREVRSGECATCHLERFNAVTDPVHVGHMPTTCGDCHGTAAWRPALGGGHPEDRFPLAGGPHALACQSCHLLDLGSSTGGQNTSCIGCHLGTHTQSRVDPVHGGVAGYGFDAAAPHFCLSCHPDGTALDHPESRFPIDNGAHSQIRCADCHDSTLGMDSGGMNVNCTGCHTGIHARSRMDPKHREVRSYAWSDSNKQFCRACHPRGRNNN